jgi:DNA-binding transcriptional MerR regulator
VSLRPIDLARAAGISAATIRMYEDEGILPPAIRLPSGHRRYTGADLEALQVARALMTAYGWIWTRDAMRLVHAGDTRSLARALDLAHASLQRQREDLAQTLVMLDALVHTDLADHRRPFARQPLHIGDVATTVGVPTTTIRFWEDQGLCSPSRDRKSGYRTYDPATVRDIRVIVILRDAGYGIEAMRPILHELGNRNPEAVRRILLQRQDQIDRTSQQRYAAVGRLWRYIERLGEQETP